MSRHSQRCHFPTTNELLLSGILEIPSGTPQGAILFSHCFTCNKDLKSIVRISRELAQLGWIVFRYDFRGLGNSQGDFVRSNFTTNLADLESAAKFLESESTPASFLMGHSFGGAASLAMAERLPTVKGVIALAAPSDTHHLANLLEKMSPNLLSGEQGEVTIGGFRYQVDPTMPSDFRSYDLPSLVDQMEKPLVALHSRTDETVSYQHAIKNCGFHSESLKLRHRSLVTLPDCNHLISNETVCHSVARIVDSWCRCI